MKTQNDVFKQAVERNVYSKKDIQEYVANKSIMIVDSANGQYIPQIFAERYEDQLFKRIDDATAKEIMNPENEYYWECWNEVLDNFQINDMVLIHDEDLYLVPKELAEYWEYI